MTREEAIDHLCARAYARELIGDHKTAQAIGIVIQAVDEIRNAIWDLDWYHINPQGELVHGANSDKHTALYKASDIFKIIGEYGDRDSEEVGDGNGQRKSTVGKRKY